MAGAFVFTVGAITRHSIRVDSGGNLQVFSHPTGSAAWWGAVQNAVLFALAVCWLVSLAGGVVQAALEPAHVWIWTSRPD